ncbi:15284_t:CDS:2, partial [Dentiscutata heterogama]
EQLKSTAEKIIRENLQETNKNLLEAEINLPEKAPTQQKKSDKENYRRTEKLPKNSSKPGEESCQRTNSKFPRNLPENSSKSGEENSSKSGKENYQKTASKFPRNLPEKNFKPGEENYERKTPNLEKKLQGKISKPGKETRKLKLNYIRVKKITRKHSKKPTPYPRRKLLENNSKPN